MTEHEAVKALRKHLGLTQLEFSQKLGCNLITICRHENGVSPARSAKLAKLHALAIETGRRDLADIFRGLIKASGGRLSHAALVQVYEHMLMRLGEL